MFLQVLKDFSLERAKKMVVIFHILHTQLQFIFNARSNRKWDFRLHTLDINHSSNDTQYWVVCWRVDDGTPFLVEKVSDEDQRCECIKYIANIHLINFLLRDRQSMRCLLNGFPDSKEYKISGATVNPSYQQPFLLFMKHIMCWSNYGDLIVDATSGT